MNELFEVSVLAVSPDPDIDFTSIVGKGAALRIQTPNYKADHTAHAWAGVCAHISQVHAQPSGENGYHIMVVPMFWRTTLRKNCRIFQHLTTPDIVKKILGEYGITFDDKMTTQTYKKHEYCVQYGETDYAFICRLLEDAGISFYFAQAADSGKGMDVTKLVLHDAPHLNAPRGGSLAYAGHHVPRFGADEEFCASVTLT